MRKETGLCYYINSSGNGTSFWFVAECSWTSGPSSGSSGSGTALPELFVVDTGNNRVRTISGLSTERTTSCPASASALAQITAASSANSISKKTGDKERYVQILAMLLGKVEAQCAVQALLEQRVVVESWDESLPFRERDWCSVAAGSGGDGMGRLFGDSGEVGSIWKWGVLGVLGRRGVYHRTSIFRGGEYLGQRGVFGSGAEVGFHRRWG